MSNPTTAQAEKTEAKNGTKPAGNMHSRFTKIETERYMYNPDKTREAGHEIKPLVGYLLNHNPMPPMDGRDWEAYVISTTELTYGIDREKAVIEVPIGSEVLVPATYQLTQFLLKAAAHPTHVFEMYIEPRKKLDLPNTGGRKMWLYDLGYNKNNSKPRGEFGPAAMLGAPQLPPRGQDTAEEVSDSDTKTGKENIPF